MRFLSMIRIDESTGQVPSEQLMNDMGKLIDEMTKDGSVRHAVFHGLRDDKPAEDITEERAKAVKAQTSRKSAADKPATATKKKTAKAAPAPSQVGLGDGKVRISAHRHGLDTVVHAVTDQLRTSRLDLDVQYFMGRLPYQPGDQATR